MKLNKFKNSNFFFWKFSTIKIHSKEFESAKFIKYNKKQISKIFDKGILTHEMTHNIIYFSTKYWNMSNISRFIRPLLITLNSSFKFFFKSFTSSYLTKYYFLNSLKKKLFFNKFSKFLTKSFNINSTNITLINKFFDFFYSKSFDSNSKKSIIKKKNTDNYNIVGKEFKIKSPIKAFVYVRSTWNNFFVTVIDNNGRTLVTWSGGMGEWTASRQRASVFSADSAVYEACFLAKKWGVESLNIHIWSTFRLPQIRNSFEGLEASGLEINELLYRPKMAFGGCRGKRPRRV